ncbi:MAG: hypothetical protein M1837_005970 [Sclerophora amabilis]|nr:MAG: hypothetical protein M1837_005970 [Sclerophora amabilis]
MPEVFQMRSRSGQPRGLDTAPTLAAPNLEDRRQQEGTNPPIHGLAVIYLSEPYRGTLSVLEYSASDSGETVIRGVRQLFYEKLSGKSWTLPLLFSRIVVETIPLASLNSTLQGIDLKRHKQIIIPVSSDASEASGLLTEAFHSPDIVQGQSQSIFKHGECAVVLRWATDKLRICYVLLSILFAAPVLAVVLANVSRQIEVGVAVFVGLFTIVSTLQALIAWGGQRSGVE